MIRPLRLLSSGAWRSRDGRWTFLRHETDPNPKRWFAYLDESDWPSNPGDGHHTLKQAADWAERKAVEPLDFCTRPVAESVANHSLHAAD